MNQVELINALKVEGPFHQAFEDMDIDSIKPVEERMDMYGIDKLVSPGTMVLDIGCNSGLIDIYLAKRGCLCSGIDIKPEFIKAAKVANEHYETNCEFACFDINKYKTYRKFDLVLALEIHMWTKMRFPLYAKKIMGYVRERGHLIFETHNIMTVDTDWRDKFKILEKYGKIIKTGETVDRITMIPRMWMILKK